MGIPMVVSLSGIGDRSLEHCAEFAAELDLRRTPLTLLVAPRPSGSAPPGPDRPAVSWVRARQRRCDALALHGFDHAPSGQRLLPRVASSGPAAAVRGAEFAALPAHEAGLRLHAATAALDRLGLRTDLFVPPRWLSSPGTVTALRGRGFAVCADALAVHELATGRVHRARVHALGPGERVEHWWCRALVLGVGRAARRGRMVRLAVDAADLSRPGPRRAVLDSIDLALHHGAEPATYAAFADAVVPRQRRAPRSSGRLPNLDPLSS
ncbi:DUF2334 domain-containing protein [Saccharopolyspora sp. NFXS83]|uniref:DUF2334 domain-containing protein n=1 Tax=Saccharopolyspora sp. NFXS83 TaxID=2993560 RepID=UPI00224B13D8|nr:DUF2334 domain-containing protein [Saccharopolyspora sp. NFXS83]MCX2728689.1 DUF2334 domain-containing protein [Saccharopolyspora sp. NFXS83]